MKTVRVVYPNVLDIGCFFAHVRSCGRAFSNSDATRVWSSLADAFLTQKLLWKEQTGRAMTSYTATRWWSKWEIFHQLLVQFGDILPFLERNVDLSPVSRNKLLAILQNVQKSKLLNIELAAVVDYGEPFVK